MTTLTGGRSERTASSWARPVVLLLATGPVVSTVGLVAVPACWPAAAPAAVAVALARLEPSVRRPASRALLVAGVLTGVGLGSLASRMLRHPADVAALAIADVAHAAVAGLVLAAGGGLRLRSVRDLVRLAVAAAGGAVVAGVVVALTVRSGAVVVDVVASRACAVIVLVPLVLSLSARPRRASAIETAGSWVVVVGATVLALGPAGGLPAMFLPVAAIVVAALRQSPRSTFAQLLVVGALAAVATGYGVGAFARYDDGIADRLVQIYLIVVAVTVLVVVLVVGARDVALTELDDRLRFDRAALESVAVGVLVCDADGRMVLRNAAYRRICDVVGAAPPDAGPDGLRECERNLLARALGGARLRGIPARSGTPDSPGDVVADAGPIRATDGRLLGAVATFTDVTDERAVQTRLREALTFHDAVLAASPDVIFITDVATHRVVWASGTVQPTLGYSPREVVELDRASKLNLVHPDDVGALHAADDAAAGLHDGEVRRVRVRMSNDRGESRWMSRRVTPFTRDADGRVTQLLGVSRDVTDVVEVERRLTDAATRDPLTGALNRRALLDRLGALVDRVAETGAAATPVLFCDLDGFKAVNDSLGHAAGDLLLTTVAQRISAGLRDGDTMARAGGDEFVLLLEPSREVPPVRSADSRSDALHNARAVGRRILDTVSRPVVVQGSCLTITISIGIALVRPGIGPDEVLRDADAAMYRAKSTGKNRLHVFEVAPDRPERRA